MKIVKENPPMLESILRAGMLPNLQSTIFTYGDTIYNPGDIYIPDHLIEHEITHKDQQGDDPDAWWARYVNDPYFRLDQESKAYGRQYKFICRKVTDKNKRFLILNDLAGFLSSPTYGKMITRDGAAKMIRQLSGIAKP